MRYQRSKIVNRNAIKLRQGQVKYYCHIIIRTQLTQLFDT